MHHILTENDMILPQIQHKKDGSERRVGLEFEFAKLGPEAAAEAVREVFGGEIKRKNSFVFTVEETEVGKFTVEMDAAMLKEKRYEEYLQFIGIDVSDEAQRLEQMLLGLASDLVPCEVVTPPLPFSVLTEAEALRRRLHELHARGTRASFTYAFGLHFNVEPPDTSLKTLLAYLRSFLLLEDWIRERGVDLTRVISPYIDRFPASYLKYVLDEKYWPSDVRSFADDYMKYNPTRNRALDMLPMFAELVPEELEEHPVEHDLIQGRPAFHYRLPDCRLDDSGWSVEFEWESWLEVERVANDPELLTAMTRDWFESRRISERVLGDSWPDRVAKWLDR